MIFRKPVDLFAPAFIVSGDKVRTPQAECRIRSAKDQGDRQTVILYCLSSVAGDQVRAFLAPQPDGTLRRYLNAEDTVGTIYKQCQK
jgi:hypothetical protein